MRKQGSKLLLVVLTFFMIFGCVNVYPVKAKTTQKEYEIYRLITKMAIIVLMLLILYMKMELMLILKLD